MFQHRHYVAIAAALTAVRPQVGEPNYVGRVTQWRRDVSTLQRLFQRDNPRFDCLRFASAVSGVPDKRDK